MNLSSEHDNNLDQENKMQAQATNDSIGADEQELLRLQRLLIEASLKGDWVTLARYIADDFVLTYAHSDTKVYGKYLDKDQVLAMWAGDDAGGEQGLHFSEISEQRVQISGSTGVAFARIVDRFPTEEGMRSASTWVMDVWVKRESGWMWFASHETILTDELVEQSAANLEL